MPLEIEQSRPPTPSPAVQGGATAKKPASRLKTASMPSFDPDDSDDSLDPDNLIPEFLSLRSQLYNLRPDYFDQPKKGKKTERGKGTGHDSDPQIAKIKYKLSKIENDVLFDREEAEDRWMDILIELKREAAFVRKTESESENITLQHVKETEDKTTKQELADVMSPLAEEENADIFGDMFSTEASATELTAQVEPAPANLQIRDFGKWTGLSPRRVLEDACKARSVTPLFYMYLEELLT